MKLLSFSRSYWEMAVACGGAKDNVLRNYDIVALRKEGKTIGQIAIKYTLSERQVINILNEYK